MTPELTCNRTDCFENNLCSQCLLERRSARAFPDFPVGQSSAAELASPPPPPGRSSSRGFQTPQPVRPSRLLLNTGSSHHHSFDQRGQSYPE